MSTRTAPRPIVLLILDGWGHAEPAPDNAISLAHCPNWRRLWASAPHTLIRTDGPAVGLPEGQMGNSEVGHMNLGAGRIAYPELTRIEVALSDGSFYENPELRTACAAAKAGSGRLHVLGLLSPGGVHSHEEQIHAMLRLAVREGVPEVCVHAFLDGRDTPPRSAAPSLVALAELCRTLRTARIASIGGRYFGMDRDQRWERVERHWRAIVDASAAYAYADAEAALEAAYARGENDEFVQPSLIGQGAPVGDGDAVVFMNFRADRARQLCQALLLPEAAGGEAAVPGQSFSGFVRSRVPRLGYLTTLTEYQKGLPASVAFPPPFMPNTLPAVLSARGLKQLRIAETEKYAHVTFFFSGGREEVFPGETRIMVPSPKVASYDLQPEMSCPEVTRRLVAAIGSGEFDVVICNLANPDMVGHTGVLAAAVKAVEAVDQALGEIEAAVRAAGGELLITADHGNLEDMYDEVGQQPNTQHSTNPVPLVFVGRPARLRASGALQDIAPTILELLGLDPPLEMTGVSMLVSG